MIEPCLRASWDLNPVTLQKVSPELKYARVCHAGFVAKWKNHEDNKIIIPNQNERCRSIDPRHHNWNVLAPDVRRL